MSVGTVSAAVTAGTQTASSKATSKLASDFNTFLTLLTNQLKHQDPLNPTDSSKFTDQLVAFSGVEQQIQMNKNLEHLSALTKLNNVGNVASYLGHDALIEAPFGDHTTDGIKWQYSNAQQAGEVKLQVLSHDNTIIYETIGQTSQGLHKFNWDGKDANGTLQAAGNYQLKVKAKDLEGRPTTVGVAVQETITAVNTKTATPIFTIGPNNVPQGDILSLVRNP